MLADQRTILINLLLAGMVLLSLASMLAIFRKIRRTGEPYRPKAEVTAVMAVIWFFETLGIGAVATSTSYYRLRKLVAVPLIPPTLFVAAAPLYVIKGWIYIKLIEVDISLMICCVFAAVAGALLGSKLVEKLPTSRIKLLVGVGLLAAAAFMLLGNLGVMPVGGTALSLEPLQFSLAVLSCFIFASLLNIGIGIFAPVMMVMMLMGLDPRAVFPILAVSCAYLLPATALRVINRREIDMRLVTSTIIGATPAIIVAAVFVQSMPVTQLRWIVMFIVLYAAATILAGEIRRGPKDRQPQLVA